jgi:hypothetical protein
MKNDKPRREKMFDEMVCLQRDSLDLYVDDVCVASSRICKKGMDELKDMAHTMCRSGVLFQIKIRNSVQWESIPTQIEDEPDGGWPKIFDMAVM